MSWQTSNHIRSFSNAIVHVDGDAFFASCEQAINPKYKNKVVVTGKERGIASSMSYEAKKLGIKRGMRLFEIKKICPQAIILPSDYETYSLFSKRMFSIMRRFTPMVEEYSIDEAFADLTGLRRPMKMSYEKMVIKMKEQIDRELGFTVSLGLASSKVLAKVASKWKKPNGLTIIYGRDIKDFLKQLKVKDIWGVGVNTANYMNKLGIITALDFINKPYEWIQKKFTKPHQEMWRELNGEMVYDVIAQSKSTYASISKTRTFTPATNDKKYIFSQLVKNLENACIKLRRHNLIAKRLVILIKTQQFKIYASEAIFSRASAYPNEMIGVAEELFKKIYSPVLQYRATGVVLSKIQENKNIQYSLFEPPLKIEKSQNIFSAVDSLSKRFGKHTIHLGSSLKANSFQHTGDRSDMPERRKIELKGETKRRRLRVPILQQIVR